jgi:hypothetical protein
LSPIAWFQPSKTYITGESIPETGPAYLALEKEAEEIQDTVVLSMLILEQKDRWSKARASALLADTSLGNMLSPGLPTDLLQLSVGLPGGQ